MAEAPRVREPQLRTIVELEGGSKMARLRMRLIQAGCAEARIHQVQRNIFGPRRFEQEVPRHPQMHDDAPPALQSDD
jgi:hypothetical protein